MSEIDIKEETSRNEDSDSCDAPFPDLTELLNDVKKEEFTVDNTRPSQIQESEEITESFFDDLLREELAADSPASCSDADIERLQELIEKKKRILNEDDESSSEGISNRKRKEGGADEQNVPQSKRPRNVEQPSGSRSPDTPVDGNSSRSKSPVLLQSEIPPANNTNNLPPSTSANNSHTENDETLASELELENLLKAEDYHSDDETPNHSQGITATNNLQPSFEYPNAMTMIPPVYDPTTNQMMGNQMMGSVPPGGFPFMFPMVPQPGFYPPNMQMQMQMMGYGYPQMNIPSNTDEVQCLPVTNNSGMCSVPFKRIKIERKKDPSSEEDKEAASAEERRRKILERCTTLFEQMEFIEPSGKFVHTPTVTKLNSDAISNSVLQKVTNVSYDYHSIGPKTNVNTWGLKEIPSTNAEIAKKISMSAEKYFAKIEETANTIARKLIKVEEDKAKANAVQEQTEMELEEPTLSSFLKNSMTQTDDLVCRECVARKRKVGHDIEVQATVYSGSIGTQTDPMMNPNEHITAGLNENQMKAVYEFSNLIREPAKKTTEELYKLRENLICVYNLSQRQYRGPVPNVPAFESTGQQVRGSRFDNGLNSDPRRFSNPGTQVHSPAAVQAPMQNFPNYQGAQVHSPAAIQAPMQTFPNYQPQVSPVVEAPRINFSSFQQPMVSQMPNNRNPDPPGYKEQSLQGHPNPMHNHQQQNLNQYPDNRGQVRPRAQFQGVYNPSAQGSRDVRPPQQYPGSQRPAVPDRGYPNMSPQEGRKNYGRGGLRR